MDDGSMVSMKMGNDFSYDFLRLFDKIIYLEGIFIKEILFNFMGNMNCYVWSMNGVLLLEIDKINIREGEVICIILNNLIMMYYLMYLYGYFFRVLNKNGEYLFLKYMVNVFFMQ